MTAEATRVKTVDGDASELHHHWLNVAGLRMHSLIRTGRDPGRPPLVFVHAFGMSSSYLTSCLDQLDDGWGAFAPDLPGFGLSEHPEPRLDIPGLADALAAWMQQLDLAPAVLVANSMGCQVATSLAARYPQLVRGLVLASPPLQPESRSVPLAVARYLHNLKHERPPLLALSVTEYVKTGLTSLLATLPLTIHYPLERDLPRIAAPTLVVHGSRDSIVNRDWCRRVTRTLPRGEFAALPHAAHLIPHNSPAALARLVQAFAASS